MVFVVDFFITGTDVKKRQNVKIPVWAKLLLACLLACRLNSNVTHDSVQRNLNFVDLIRPLLLKLFKAL